MSRQHLQSLLVTRDILSPEEVDESITAAQDKGGTWIEHVLAAGILDEERLADWISHESKVPRCELTQMVNLPLDVVAQVPPEVALEHRLVPISLDDDGYLHVAMVDPLDATSIEEVEFFAGLPLMRHVAVATSVAWALHRYYGERTPLWAEDEVVAAAVPAVAG